ncbi:MAG TPA: nuclear transport factor 2 family protein [Solirubrobacteraceae bacterium]|jgi:ketosteroid isomerase-like protein|nr:nuclear transport factor 2 family protein [Solirubrobacteraceae bacterium]
MSRANVEIAKRVIDAFNRRDLDAILECVTRDVEWLPAMPVTFGGAPLRGREGIESYIREVSDTWDEYHVVGQDLRDLGVDQVLVLSRIEGRGAGSGGLVDAAMGQIFEFRDSKIARVRTYLDHGEALRAAGLAE